MNIRGGVIWFIMDSRRVLHPAPSVLGVLRKHISNRDVGHHLEQEGAYYTMCFMPGRVLCVGEKRIGVRVRMCACVMAEGIPGLYI